MRKFDLNTLALTIAQRLEAAVQVALAAGMESVLADLDEIATEAQSRTGKARSRAAALKENPPAKRKKRQRP